MPTCPQCRRYVPKGSRFCMSCGIQLKELLLPADATVPGVCPKCGCLMQRRRESEGEAPFYTYMFRMGPREFYQCTNCNYKRRV